MKFNTTGERIRYARKKAGITVKELAARAGLAPSTIYDLERGDSKSTSRLHAIASAVGFSARWLDSERGPESGSIDQYVTNGENIEPTRPTMRMLPCISFANAGNFEEVIDSFEPGDADNYYPAPSGVKCSEYAYWTVVGGYSMTNPSGPKSFPPGTMIMVEPTERCPPNGSFVIARLPNTYEATFKRLNYEDGQYNLEPLNPQYSIITVDHPIEIIGTVKHAIISVSI